VFGVLGAWDGIWYRRIASGGYLLIPGRQSDPAFFPLYPVLLRAFHATGLGYLTSGIVLSNAMLLVALVAVEALTREVFDGTFARRTTIYVAVFPFGYVFSMMYPESFVLASVALAALAANRGRWWWAAVFSAGAALARPEGLFVAVPVLQAAWVLRRETAPVKRGVAVTAVLAPAAALASFPLYLGYVLGDPLAWNHAEQAWGRRFSPLGFLRTFGHLPRALATHPWLVRDIAACVVYVGLLAVSRRAGVPTAWFIGAVAIVLLPLFSGSFESVGRFGLLAPPLFWALAWLGGRRRGLDYAIRGVSVALLVGATLTIPFVFP
jgi:hypothetical protein